MRILRSASTGSVLLAFGLYLAARPVLAENAVEGGEFFEKKVRPILAEHCYKCHSAHSEKLKGGLLLDNKEGILKGGESEKPAVVPGDADKSLLIEAVRYQNEELKMPPPKEGKLNESQIADLVAWVRMGAPYPQSPTSAVATAVEKPAYNYAEARKWWAFQPLGKPVAPPAQNRAWTQSPIDRFVLARLEEKGLSPASPADKRTLIRRATFDLIGLPPTPSEVEAFLADDTPNAFARVVDRLLASPHYGERWGRHWLDGVRYTDSFDARGIGGEADVPEAYRYRDWVVHAFNRDLPYDQFVVDQIAGDILAEQGGCFDSDKLVATGVMAIGEWGTGDADRGRSG